MIHWCPTPSDYDIFLLHSTDNNQLIVSLHSIPKAVSFLPIYIKVLSLELLILGRFYQYNWAKLSASTVFTATLCTSVHIGSFSQGITHMYNMHLFPEAAQISGWSCVLLCNIYDNTPTTVKSFIFTTNTNYLNECMTLTTSCDDRYNSDHTSAAWHRTLVSCS